jgi:hypothetical protein
LVLHVAGDSCAAEQQRSGNKTVVFHPNAYSELVETITSG